MKRTPWFPASVNPVRKGWYECLYAGSRGDTRMRWWSGKKWGYSNIPGHSSLFGMESGDQWRGLTEEAK